MISAELKLIKVSRLSPFLTLLSVLVLQLFFGTIVYAGEKADVSILLFKDGKPLENASLLVDGNKFADFSESGSVYGKVDEGAHVFSVLTADNISYDFEIKLAKGENLQAIVTLFNDGTPPRVDIESSVSEAQKAAETAEKENKNKEKGLLNGQVVDAETGKPIQGIQVYITGVKDKLLTDKDGKFSINVFEGTYNLSLLHSAYSSRSRENIQVAANKPTNLDFSMAPAGVELPEHVVLEPHLAGSIASAISEQKDSSAVSTVLGAEQISRSGDSDVAAALRRASGVTLVNGKFVFVRGLGERFSSTLINTAPMPSPDPTRRVVPLDLFPTSFLESIMVQKTYSVDRPGEFAGGTVDMRTREIPDEFVMRFSGQVGFVEGTTFEEGIGYSGGDTDFLGIEDGSRDLPPSLERIVDNGQSIRSVSRFNPTGFTDEEIEVLGEDLSRVWNVNPEHVGPDGRIEFSLGNVFELGDFELGFISSVRWSQQWDVQQEIRRTFATTQSRRLVTKEDMEVNRTGREVQLNGYLATEVRYKEHHRFFGKMFVLRQTLDEARISEGFTDAETNDIRNTRLQYIENQLATLQLGTEHTFDFLNDLNVKWMFTKAQASRDAPNERRYRFDQLEPDQFDENGQFIPEELREEKWAFSRRAGSNQTNYSELDDKEENWRLDVKLPVDLTQDIKLNLMSGFLDQSKKRESAIRRFRYNDLGPDASDPNILGLSTLEDILVPEYIGTNGFQLEESTQATDNYTAEQELFSYYGQLQFNLFDIFSVTGGLRWEENDQTVTTFELFSINDVPVESTISRTDMLPAVSATWFITDHQQLRLGFSETISRPDFRELSPAPFIDPVNDNDTVGNPDLEQTSITNYDARYEFYFSDSEFISGAFFWKELTKPIEKVVIPGIGNVLTFQNAESARLFGFELEIMKKLGFIWSGLEDFYVGANYTWSDSSVVLNEESRGAQSSLTRPLQGHAATVINAQIGYDNSNLGTTATLLFNTTSKRIVLAGISNLPDSYQQPFNQLDFVINQRLNEWFSLNFRMKNILDDSLEIHQGDEITRQFKPGREFKLGFRIDF